jgi:LacI family transcriptional regulator
MGGATVYATGCIKSFVDAKLVLTKNQMKPKDSIVNSQSTKTVAITINHLAEHLGVHKSTISRAMDPARRHLISSELLLRVETAAKRLGYRPNHAAAALATGKSKTIGVLVPDITNPVFPPILRGIEDTLQNKGYFALLANTAGGADAAKAAAERMLAQRVEGFLVASASRDDPWLEGLRKSGAFIVLVNRSSQRGKLPAVLSDDAMGMRFAVNHLVALGHRKIAHLAGPSSLSTGFDRRAGFEVAMQTHRLVPAAIHECSAYSVAAGRVAIDALLPSPIQSNMQSPFSAIVASNDLIALGALQRLKELGISVPLQISLLGHNDMPLLDQVSPPLSSIRIQHYEMGFRAANLLLEGLHQGGQSNGAFSKAIKSVLLTPELVIRESTAPPFHGL